MSDMSDQERLAREHAELVDTDRRLGLEAELTSAREEIARLRRRLARLQARLEEQQPTAAPEPGGWQRLRRRVSRRLRRRAG